MLWREIALPDDVAGMDWSARARAGASKIDRVWRRPPPAPGRTITGKNRPGKHNIHNSGGCFPHTGRRVKELGERGRRRR